MAREILLHDGSVTLVDDADHQWLSQFEWKCYSGRACCRVRRNGKPVVLTIPQLLMNPEPGLVVDHINGDPLDNQRSNLRVCTQAQNLRNQKVHCHSRSRFKGVGWDIKRSSWNARIGTGAGRKRLGYYKTQEEAARAYDVAARQRYGEFARLNFPDAEIH